MISNNDKKHNGADIMYNTVKMFKQYVIPEKLNEPIENLAFEYQATHSQAIFATAFYLMYRPALAIANHYYGVTSQDVSSWAVEKLEYCLETFRSDFNGKFITYFCTVLDNKLKEETKALNMQKRKVYLLAESYEQLVEDGFDEAIDPSTDFTVEALDFSEALTERETQFCYMVVQQYTSLEIAEALGVSQMTLTNIRKQLRLKIKR